MPTEKEKPKNIYQKLLEIQKQIIGLGKDKSSFSFKYVTGDKVLEHVKPLMNSLGVLLKQEVISIENTRQDYATKSGTTSEINSKVMMRFTWIDCETGDKEECLFGANGQNAWDKGVGSALTYGERYFLLKFFHIATDEDDIDNPDRKPIEVPAQAAIELADESLRNGLLILLDGYKAFYEPGQLAKIKKVAEALPKEGAEEFKTNLQNGILKRVLTARMDLNQQASPAQLDLIDKMLLSRIFTAEEKAAFNTGSFEYTGPEAADRIDWLTKETKARKATHKPA